MDEAAWINQVRAGDDAAFERLFKTYFNDLVSFSETYVASPDIAEDVVQDVFLKIWSAGEAWQPKGSLRAYLFAAVRNESFYHLRRYRNRSRLLELWKPNDAAPEHTPETELEHKQLQSAAERAIEAMPERRRHIFTLSRQHGLTYAEIAALLGISVKTVDTQMGRALKAIRDRLGTVLS